MKYCSANFHFGASLPLVPLLSVLFLISHFFILSLSEVLMSDSRYSKINSPVYSLVHTICIWTFLLRRSAITIFVIAFVVLFNYLEGEHGAKFMQKINLMEVIKHLIRRLSMGEIHISIYASLNMYTYVHNRHLLLFFYVGMNLSPALPPLSLSIYIYIYMTSLPS